MCFRSLRSTLTRSSLHPKVTAVITATVTLSGSASATSLPTPSHTCQNVLEATLASTAHENVYHSLIVTLKTSVDWEMDCVIPASTTLSIVIGIRVTAVHVLVVQQMVNPVQSSRGIALL